MMKSVLKCLCILLLLKINDSTLVDRCVNGAPFPVFVEIDGCLEQPCRLRRGTDALMAVDFTTFKNVDWLHTQVNVTSFGLSLTHPLPEPDGCKGLVGRTCPLKPQDSTTYVLRIPILPVYPQITLDLTFSLLDEDNNSIVCFQVRCRVI